MKQTNTVHSDTPLSLEDQYQRLIHKGLIIDNRVSCVEYLQNISYKRLISYSYHYSIPSDNDPWKFRNGTNLKHLLNLYRFDRHLRRIVFNAIERIEVSFRAQLIQQYSPKYGGKWFLNESLFKNKQRFDETLHTIKYHLDRNRTRKQKEEFPVYTNDMIPVAWIALEQVSFGLLSKIFGNLRSTEEKKSVAAYFNLPSNYPEILGNWMQNINQVRNICAHHSKLWDHANTAPIKIWQEIPFSQQWITIIPSPDNKVETEFVTRKLYLSICAVYYLLRKTNPRTRFAKNLMGLFQEFPETPLAAMGFPSEWKQDIFWNREAEENHKGVKNLKSLWRKIARSLG